MNPRSNILHKQNYYQMVNCTFNQLTLPEYNSLHPSWPSLSFYYYIYSSFCTYSSLHNIFISLCISYLHTYVYLSYDECSNNKGIKTRYFHTSFASPVFLYFNLLVHSHPIPITHVLIRNLLAIPLC